MEIIVLVISILIFGLVVFFIKEHDLEGMKDQLVATKEELEEKLEKLNGLLLAHESFVQKREELQDTLNKSQQDQEKWLHLKDQFLAKRNALLKTSLTEQQAVSILSTYNQNEIDQIDHLDLFSGYDEGIKSYKAALDEKESFLANQYFMEDELDLGQEEDLIEEERLITEEQEWEDEREREYEEQQIQVEETQRQIEEQQQQLDEELQLEEQQQLMAEQQRQMDEDMNNNHRDMIRAEMEEGQVNGMGFHPDDYGNSSAYDDLDSTHDDYDMMDDFDTMDDYNDLDNIGYHDPNEY
ncbi:hypothetical protein [Gracilibacillus xinjiangensis]|uniref:Uncharacterized protein n=1 Tax=Gracilibacillus xinjiangensis TaxID=1193282 RepID=A0ABV8WT00_9BACI